MSESPRINRWVMHGVPPATVADADSTQAAIDALHGRDENQQGPIQCLLRSVIALEKRIAGLERFNEAMVKRATDGHDAVAQAILTPYQPTPPDDARVQRIVEILSEEMNRAPCGSKERGVLIYALSRLCNELGIGE